MLLRFMNLDGVPRSRIIHSQPFCCGLPHSRTINNYCSDANDVSREVKYNCNLFERVAPGTYRLRSWPERPDLIEIQRVKFDDDAYHSTWELFLTGVPESANSMSKRELLEVFATAIQPGGLLHDELKHRKEFYSQKISLTAADLQVLHRRKLGKETDNKDEHHNARRDYIDW